MSEIQYAVLNFGFAESYQLGSLTVANVGAPFENEHEALFSLANDLLAMYKQDQGMNDLKNDCCQENAGRNYCPECGTDLREDGKVYAGEFEDWLVGLVSRDLDSIGTLEDDVEERILVWELGHSAGEVVGESADRVLVISEQAEQKLSEVLGLEQ